MNPSDLEEGLLLLKSAQTFKTVLDDIQLSHWAQKHLGELLDEHRRLQKALLEARIEQTPSAPWCYRSAREALARKQLKAEGFDLEDI